MVMITKILKIISLFSLVLISTSCFEEDSATSNTTGADGITGEVIINSNNSAGVSTGNPGETSLPKSLLFDPSSIDNNANSDSLSFDSSKTNDQKNELNNVQPEETADEVLQMSSALKESTRSMIYGFSLLKDLIEFDTNILQSLSDAGVTSLDEKQSVKLTNLSLCGHKDTDWDVELEPNNEALRIEISSSLTLKQIAVYEVVFDENLIATQGVFTCATDVGTDVSIDINTPDQAYGYFAFAYDMSDATNKHLIFRGVLTRETLNPKIQSAIINEAFNIYYKCNQETGLCSVEKDSISTKHRRVLNKLNVRMTWDIANGDRCMDAVSYKGGEITTTEELFNFNGWVPSSEPCTLEIFSPHSSEVLITEQMIPRRAIDGTSSAEEVMSNWDAITIDLYDNWIYKFEY
jgi:hypothetical protein